MSWTLPGAELTLFHLYNRQSLSPCFSFDYSFDSFVSLLSYPPLFPCFISVAELSPFLFSFAYISFLFLFFYIPLFIIYLHLLLLSFYKFTSYLALRSSLPFLFYFFFCNFLPSLPYLTFYKFAPFVISYLSSFLLSGHLLTLLLSCSLYRSSSFFVSSSHFHSFILCLTLSTDGRGLRSMTSWLNVPKCLWTLVKRPVKRAMPPCLSTSVPTCTCVPLIALPVPTLTCTVAMVHSYLMLFLNLPMSLSFCAMIVICLVLLCLIFVENKAGLCHFYLSVPVGSSSSNHFSTPRQSVLPPLPLSSLSGTQLAHRSPPSTHRPVWIFHTLLKMQPLWWPVLGCTVLSLCIHSVFADSCWTSFV